MQVQPAPPCERRGFLKKKRVYQSIPSLNPISAVPATASHFREREEECILLLAGVFRHYLPACTTFHFPGFFTGIDKQSSG
jgi:hypothetical protein